ALLTIVWMSPEPVIVLPRPAGWILAGILLLAIVTPSAARVWQLVPGGGDAPSIQAAIDLAAEGDTLDLAPGFYSEPTSVVNKTLLIRGAGMDATSLSGDLDGHTVALRGGNNFTEIRDLTIQDGSAKSLGDLDGGIYGGGVLGEEAFFALVRCRIASNSCESLGGGVYATSVPFQPGSGNTIPRDARAMTRRPTSPRAAGNPAITRDHVLLSDCRIESNFGGSEGGGICMELAWFRIENCRVQGNFAGQGGGISIINSVGEVTGCLIDDNEGLLDGGGIKLDTALALPPPTVRVSHCMVRPAAPSRSSDAPTRRSTRAAAIISARTPRRRWRGAPRRRTTRWARPSSAIRPPLTGDSARTRRRPWSVPASVRIAARSISGAPATTAPRPYFPPPGVRSRVAFAEAAGRRHEDQDRHHGKEVARPSQEAQVHRHPEPDGEEAETNGGMVTSTHDGQRHQPPQGHVQQLVQGEE
ncbi:MAG: hypothetical protein FD129_2978, partial [bacterium]